MANISKITRRAFIAGSGVAVTAIGGLYVSGKLVGLQNKLYDLTKEPSQSLDLFVRIGSDNRITIVSHRVEMGQGIKTGLPIVLADEMEADWDLVDVIQAPGHPDFGNQNTDSSKSVRVYYSQMRMLGASIRLMLVRAAASVWEVNESSCKAVKHQVIHEPTGKSLSYGDLAELAAKVSIPADKELVFKKDSEYRYIGRSVPSVDGPDIVQGAVEYAIDIELPGMLHAVVENAPVLGAELISVDESQTKKIPGVVDVLVLPVMSFPVKFQPLHGVVVVAKNTWAAIKGREKLICNWSGSKYSDRGSERLEKDLTSKILEEGNVVRKNGNTEKAFRDAAQVLDATYSLPYLSHVPMEAPVAVADASFNECRMWASSQNPQNVRKNVAKLLSIPLHNVEVNVPLLGGGFGRKSKGDFCSQAALISKEMGCPIKLTWTRENDIRNGYYHAMSVHHYRAAIDKENRVVGWIQRTAYPSIRSTFNSSVDRPSDGELMGGGFTSSFYDIPNFQAETHSAIESVRIGWLRSVTSIQHSFANNCFADELSYKRGVSPVDNLLELIGPDRHIDPGFMQVDYTQNNNHPFDTSRLKRVIREVAQNSGFGILEHGKGWGVAAHHSFQSYCAVASNVTVTADKKLAVEKVHIAIDCGKIVNPDRVKAQMEGAVIFGLSIALFGKIDVENGEVLQSNFDDYPVLRANQCPSIEVHLIESSAPPSGVGEPGVPPVAPSLVNAIHAAIGERFRRLPLSQYFEI